MFDIITNRETLKSSWGLYCVWIRANQNENAPLIRVWIDPSMKMFELEAKVHEPDIEMASAATQAALRRGGPS